MNHVSIPCVRAVVGVFLLAFGTNATAQNVVPRYSLTDLGALSGFSNSRAYGLNNKGQVVGQVAKLEPQLEAHAVLWDGNKVEGITVPEGLKYSASHGINDAGQIVGGAEIQNYGSHGFHFMGLTDKAYLWDAGKLTVLSAETSHAYALNNHEQIVGESERRATLWEKGKPTLLATAADYLGSSARAINNKGQVAGIGSNKEGRRQAVLWSEGKMQALGTLPGDDQSIATAINDKGMVVGSSGKNNSYEELPFVWEKGKMEMLTPLDGRTWHNEVLGINNRDQIVGCGMQDGAYMHAVLWEKQFPKDLNDLIPAGSGLVLMKAMAINDQGQIIGEARDEKTQIHAFLLTPLEVVPAQAP
ncbi:hypothetical protein IAD21_04729 [Abditibacteriota bacterium]|nr:hypothetical protein IAD21_04729 [Abditibacteriota bacterium]